MLTDLAQVFSGQVCAGTQHFDNNILHPSLDGLEDLRQTEGVLRLSNLLSIQVSTTLDATYTPKTLVVLIV